MPRGTPIVVALVLAAAGCLPDLSGYEVRGSEEDGGRRQPGGQLPAPQGCSAPIPIGQGYTEGFESGANGWGAFAERGRPSWELGPPGDGPFAGSPGGGNVVATGLNILYPDDETSYLVSPCFDASAATTDLLFSFTRAYSTEDCCDRATVELSVDGGETWELVRGETRIGWYSSYFSGDSEWEGAATLLEGTAGQRAVQLRVKWRTDRGVQGPGFALDDVSLRPAAVDLALALEEEDRCGYVDAVVTNVGGLAVDGYDVVTTIDGVMDVETSDSSLAYLASRTVTLGGSLAQQIEARVLVPGDVDASNDDGTFQVVSVPLGAGYFSDFEADDGGLVVTGRNASWALGPPNGELIRGAASGARAWVTNPDGEHNNSERSSLRLPCMDFRAVTADPLLTLSRNVRLEECCDFARFEVSVDGGSFSTVGSRSSMSGVSWYNDSDGWTGSTAGAWEQASHPLTRVAGAQFVRLRLYFSSDGNTQFDGFALDDLAITP